MFFHSWDYPDVEVIQISKKLGVAQFRLPRLIFNVSPQGMTDIYIKFFLYVFLQFGARKGWRGYKWFRCLVNAAVISCIFKGKGGRIFLTDCFGLIGPPIGQPFFFSFQGNVKIAPDQRGCYAWQPPELAIYVAKKGCHFPG